MGNPKVTRATSLFYFSLVLFLLTGTQGNNHHPAPGSSGTPHDFMMQLRHLLLVRRSHHDADLDFQDLFGRLGDLADSMPDDFSFDSSHLQLPNNHAIHQKMKAMECLSSAHQFPQFLTRVSAVLHELRDEYMDDLESVDADTTTSSMSTDDHDDHDHHNHHDDQQSSTEMHPANSNHHNMHAPDDHMDDMTSHTPMNLEVGTHSHQSTEVGSEEETTEHPHGPGGDGPDGPATMDMDSPGDNPDTHGDADDSAGDSPRRKRDVDLEGFFDLEEMLDRLQEDDIECLTSLMSPQDERFLCNRFAHGSSVVFRMIMSAGLECEDYLLENDDDDDDDDDDDHLDDSNQRTLLRIFKMKPREEIGDDQVRKILRLAPDVIDDDFLESLPDQVFQSNMRELGRMASRRSGNPGLRYAFRERLDMRDLSNLSADDIMGIGPGLRALRLDQIDRLNASLLMQTNAAVIFAADSDGNDDDDDDDDEDDGVRLAIGRRIKHHLKGHGPMMNQSITSALPFLYDDFDFVNSVDPEDLLESLAEMRNMDFDSDDARSMLSRLAMSPRFPSPASMTGQDLTGLGHLARGLGVVQLGQLNRDAIVGALTTLKEVEFDEDQAEEILEELLDENMVTSMDHATVRHLGKLMRGMPSAHLSMVREDVVEALLDYFDDLDLNDVQKRLIVAKTRHHSGLPMKFLELDDFADVMSLDDLDEYGEAMLQAHLNVSSRINWGLPQSAHLAHLYKLANGAGRLRTSDLNAMGHVATGLLPSDLDDMLQDQDDVFDLAEELKDIQDDLTSGQINLLVTKFHDFSDLDNNDVVIDSARAMQSAHILAFLKEEHFEKLDFTHEGKAAFVSQVAKMKTHTIPRSHLQFLARTLLDMIEDTISKDSEESSSDDRQAKRLRSLGSMALGLTTSQIRGFTGNAILDNADLLKSLPFSKAQSKALMEKVDSSIPNWKCRADMLARLGPLLQHVDSPFSDDCHDEVRSSMSAIAKGLERRREMAEERVAAGLAREYSDVTDDAGEKRVVNTMLAAAIAVKQAQASADPMGKRRRKKRGTITTDGPLTCDAVMHLQRTADQVEAAHLASMRVEEFSNCFATLGSINRWSDETLAVLVNKAKSVYGGVDTWTNELSRRAGALVAGLSPAEIQQLHLTGVDAMNSIGKHGRLTVEQLKAGFRRWQSLSGNTDVANISSEEFSSLADFTCGLELADIQKLDETTFKRSLGVLGHSSSCSPEQRKAYVTKALAVYGSNIAAWSPALVGEMGHLLGGLSPDHVRKLSGQHLDLIDPMVIHNFEKEGLMAMSPAQLQMFSPSQANAVPQAVYETMSSQQMAALDAKATVMFIKAATGSETGGDGDDKDGASSIVSSVWLAASLTILACVRDV